jgi:hypothetical protein
MRHFSSGSGDKIGHDAPANGHVRWFYETGCKRLMNGCYSMVEYRRITLVTRQLLILQDLPKIKVTHTVPGTNATLVKVQPETPSCSNNC